MADKLVINEDKYKYRIQWEIDNGDDLGGLEGMMYFDIPPELAAKLTWDDKDMFLLDPGMGPTMTLGKDGYVYYDGNGWDDLGAMTSVNLPIRRATPDESVSALVVGAKKQNVPELLELIPKCPSVELVCPCCHGERWVNVSGDPNIGPTMICYICWGRGWNRLPWHGHLTGDEVDLVIEALDHKAAVLDVTYAKANNRTKERLRDKANTIRTIIKKISGQ